MNKEKKYLHYTDYIFKRSLEKYANGILKFLNLPYTIKKINQSEITDYGPKIRRLDFTGDVTTQAETLSLILECQTYIPTEDDLKRFFQYIALIRSFKNHDVELYILLTEKAPFESIDFKIKENCTYTMNVISLKNTKATDIFNRINNKLKHKKKINEEDIAALQLIVYTDFEESPAEILKKTHKLINSIEIEDVNEKKAILYILDVLSANMLNAKERNEYLEETTMLLNPRDEYMKNKGIEEGMKKGEEKGMKKGMKKGEEKGMKKGMKKGRNELQLEMVKELQKRNYPINEICEITKLTKQEIKNL